MSDSAVLDTYQCTIENNLPPLPNDNVEANEILYHIKSAVNEVSEDVVGTKTHKDWQRMDNIKNFSSDIIKTQKSKAFWFKVSRI